MKKLVVAGLILAAARCGVQAEEARFSSSVSREDLVAAGLSELTSAQRAHLDVLVESYKSGALAAARRDAAEARAAKDAAEAQSARAEAKAETARVEATKAETARVAATPAAPAPGIFARAKGLLKSSSPVDAIESSLPGKFRGWEPRQIFTLANGQRWQVANSESYYTPVVENPKVQISPAPLAGYWMRFPDLGVEVRVTLRGSE